MTKSTLKPSRTTAWEDHLAGILGHRFWKLSLRVLPGIGLWWLLWQIHDRWADLSDYSWDSALWVSVTDLSPGDLSPGDLSSGDSPRGNLSLRWGILCLVIPLVSLWVDSIKWVLMMYPSLSEGAALKLALRQLPVVAYSILGSVVVPGRLSEFAGRCRFFPTEKHPQVMASTLMASSMQWTWVLAFPGLWICGNAIMNMEIMSGIVSTEDMLKGLPVLFGRVMRNPLVGIGLVGMAVGAVMLWNKVTRKLLGDEWRLNFVFRLSRWSLIRYALLVLQWALWLNLALVTTDEWTLVGGICGMLALQWFMPLGFLLDLGVKGVLSIWVWGNVLMHPEDALAIPLLIWLSNLAFPALMGGLWWLFKGRQIQAL